MNKTSIIIGSIALLGVGAYFYFKPKSKGKTSTSGAEEGAPRIAVDKETKALKDIATKITESEFKPKDKSIDVVPKVTYENIEKALLSLGIDQTRTVQELSSINYKEAKKLAGNIKEINTIVKNAKIKYGGSKNPMAGIDREVISELSGQAIRTYGNGSFTPSISQLIDSMTKKINSLGYKVLHDYDVEKI